MTYQEARSFIDQVSAKGSELGLTSVTNLLMELGNPQDSLKFVHIAGTNGKGSVLAYLNSILKKAGYKAGRYISPTLFSYRERIQINGDYISRDDFARHAAQVSEAMDRMKEKKLGLPTVFEVETAISFLYFLEQGCDLVLLETGLGGRLDATNVIRTPILTILASISMDHMEYLGNTIAEIAWNKAGIFKPGVPVVSAHQLPDAEEVIRAEAEKSGSSLTFVQPDCFQNIRYGIEKQSFTYKDYKDMYITLSGVHQIENAALALEAVTVLRSLGYIIPDQDITAGLLETTWKGRFTIIHHNPTVIIDGAHNPDAARVLRDSMLQNYPDQKKYYIFGVFADKDYESVIQLTAPYAEHIFAVETPDNPRALPAKQLADAVSRVNPSVESCASVSAAVEKAFLTAGPDDVILAFGSLSFLCHIDQAVQMQEG